jgi:hypothetical protein
LKRKLLKAVFVTMLCGQAGAQSFVHTGLLHKQSDFTE